MRATSSAIRSVRLTCDRFSSSAEPAVGGPAPTGPPTRVSGSQGVGLVEQRLTLRGQLLRLGNRDRLCVELGAFQGGDHLPRQRVPLVDERDELILDVRVRAVVG